MSESYPKTMYGWDNYRNEPVATKVIAETSKTYTTVRPSWVGDKETTRRRMKSTRYFPDRLFSTAQAAIEANREQLSSHHKRCADQLQYAAARLDAFNAKYPIEKVQVRP